MGDGFKSKCMRTADEILDQNGLTGGLKCYNEDLNERDRFDFVYAIDEAIKEAQTPKIKVQAIQDDSSHWYLIPNDLVASFRKDLNDEDLVDSGEFSNRYGQYMTGGDLNNIQLYIEQNPES